MLEGFSTAKVVIVVDLAGRQLIGEMENIGLPEAFTLKYPFMLIERPDPRDGSVVLSLAPLHSFPTESVTVRWTTAEESIPQSIISAYQSAVKQASAAKAGITLASTMPKK